MDIINKSGNLDSADLRQKKLALNLKHKKQLVEFDKCKDDLLASADLETFPSLQVKHAHARLELRERQLNELSNSMKDFITREELSKQYSEEAEKATQAVEEFKQRTIFEMAKKIEDVKRAQRENGDEQRKAMEEEVRRLEEQLEHEKEAEALREAEKEAEMESLRQRKAREKEEAEKVIYLF